MAYPKQCPECGADWTNPANVRQWGTVGARWGGRVNDAGEWEDDNMGADVDWDAPHTKKRPQPVYVQDMLCTQCDTAFAIRRGVEELEDHPG